MPELGGGDHPAAVGGHRDLIDRQTTTDATEDGAGAPPSGGVHPAVTAGWSELRTR